MWQDMIVEEIRKVRQEHAEKFDFDLRAIFADLKEQEAVSERQIVKLAPRPISEVAVVTTSSIP